jgi:hypothetical protein
MAEIHVAIHQPNFFPWLGYFYKIAQSDVFILLDQVAYPKSGNSMSCFCNRTKLTGKKGVEYFAHPVERKSGTQLINTVEMAKDISFSGKLNYIRDTYEKFPFFSETMEIIDDVYSFSNKNISLFNINAIKKISKALKITVDFVTQSDLNAEGQSSVLLVGLVSAVKGSVYVAGAGGSKSYLDLDLFREHGIRVDFISYPNFLHYQL